jgi:rhodanese-related sulfurtransferase
MAIMFHNKGFVSAAFLNFSASEAFEECTSFGAVILDVREERLTGYKRFDVPRVVYLPKSRLADEYQTLPVDVPLIVADSVGLRSHEAIDFLSSKGFENIANMAGGIVEWEHDGLPLRIDISEQLDGSCMCQLRPRHKK